MRNSGGHVRIPVAMAPRHVSRPISVGLREAPSLSLGVRMSGQQVRVVLDSRARMRPFALGVVRSNELMGVVIVVSGLASQARLGDSPDTRGQGKEADSREAKEGEHCRWKFCVFKGICVGVLRVESRGAKRNGPALYVREGRVAVLRVTLLRCGAILNIDLLPRVKKKLEYNAKETAASAHLEVSVGDLQFRLSTLAAIVSQQTLCINVTAIVLLLCNIRGADCCCLSAINERDC